MSPGPAMRATRPASAGPIGRVISLDRLPVAARALRLGRIAPYSRFVSVMKVLLPALAVALLGVVVAWPQINPDKDFKAGFAGINTRNVDTTSMAKPRYLGVDEKNHPYTVTADVATEVDPAQSVVALDAPKADMVTNDGSGVVVVGNAGYYRRQQQIMDVVGDVQMYHDKGYEAHTASARIDFGADKVTGDEPVTGNGPAGRLDGESFMLLDKGRTVFLNGKSHMTFNSVARGRQQ